MEDRGRAALHAKSRAPSFLLGFNRSGHQRAAAAPRIAATPTQPDKEFYLASF